jgi:hypothetical protein
LLKCLAALAGAAACAPALAQPFNVRAWDAAGQVFVVWQQPAPPAVPTDTVEIYASAAAQINVGAMQRIGRMFFPEYTGARLTALAPAARLTIPTPGGGTYTLAPDEGVFAFTPRAAGNLFFAVVETGAVVVGAANSAATAFGYNPAVNPVRPHPQFNGVTPLGNPYTAYVVWGEGRDDISNRRPDVPVMGDFDKNGVPHVFVVTRPVAGLPAGPIPALFAHHGGGGEYQLFLPGVPARANVSLTLNDGVVVTPDDSYYANVGGSLERSNTGWFGYASIVDPFFAGVRNVPPVGSIVSNYTQQRVYWIMDWITSPISPFPVDRNRIAAIGHSGGGRGLSHLSRTQPERYSSVICYTPASDLTIPPGNRENFLIGNWTDNLATNLVGPGNVTLGVTDVFDVTNRVSPTQRDFAQTRFFYGKRDLEDAAAWSPAQRVVVDDLEATQKGIMIFWDEREHGVEKWSTEENDATDGIPGPWPDIGQWIAPVRTFRASGQYLTTKYRANQSYPGFFSVDQSPLMPGRQPDPGPGNPNLGDAWGTWGGYLEWDTTTIVDQPNLWACTVWATGLSATTIDNAPVAEFTADFAPRKTQLFSPPNTTPIYWYVLNLATNIVTQQGIVNAEADGRVKVSGLRIPREDVARVRIHLSTAPLCLGTSGLDSTGPQEVCPDEVASFSVLATGSGPLMYAWEVELPQLPGLWTPLTDGAIIGVGAVTGTQTGTINILATTPGAVARVRSVVTGPCGSVTTTPAQLRVFAIADPACNAECNYDYNGDENVDLTDAQLMAQVAAGVIIADPSWLDGDLNGDENADLTDAQILAAYVASGICGV